jgi:peptide/nickel transport system substrate-binding protein
MESSKTARELCTGAARPGRGSLFARADWRGRFPIMAAAIVALALASAAVGPGAARAGQSSHALAMHGEAALPVDFPHFPHVNPQAPKGGRLTLGKADTFNSLNPFIIKGDSAEGLAEYVYETLMARGLDEPFSLYGLLAESVEVPPDRNSITFTVRPQARFSDGTPVTPDDVLFSQALLRDKGRPNHRRYYAKVTTAEKLDGGRVRFVFSGDGDREMPLIMGLMPILPRHRIDPGTFELTSLEKPIGSGPYVVAHVEAPHAVVFRRDPAWWGATLPVNVGRFNADEIRIEYFRDEGALFEAFRTGTIHLRLETDPAQWSGGYDFPAVRDGRVRRAEFPTGLPAAMRGFALNTRRPFLADARVRRALILAFDFEWTNKNLFRGLYTRTQSFFHGSELSAHGRPAGAGELSLLAPFGDAVAPDVLNGARTLDRAGKQGRDTLREALGLLGQAGYTVRRQQLVDTAGKPVSMEMLAVTRAQERLMLSYMRNLRQLGIDARVRMIDSAEYENRKRKFDFDLIQVTWAASLSPGNEQAFRWGSEAAGAEGSYNFPGVRSPAIDAAIGALLAASTRETFVDGARALDRLLISGDYAVPLFHVGRQWVAHWSHLKPSPKTPLFGYDLTAWWVEAAAR